MVGVRVGLRVRVRFGKKDSHSHKKKSHIISAPWQSLSTIFVWKFISFMDYFLTFFCDFLGTLAGVAFPISAKALGSHRVTELPNSIFTLNLDKMDVQDFGPVVAFILRECISICFLNVSPCYQANV